MRRACLRPLRRGAKPMLSPAIIPSTSSRVQQQSTSVASSRALNPTRASGTLLRFSAEFAHSKIASMEAASARMAARDRYGGWGEAPTSQLQRFICTSLFRAVIVCTDSCRLVNACDPQNFEPNLALNLEISDLINTKKGSS
jgi:hypothetical protein